MAGKLVIIVDRSELSLKRTVITEDLIMKIKVLNSQTLGQVQEVDLALTIKINGECLIGRSPNSGLVLNSPDVSRLHGKFIWQEGNYYFCDLGSRNGSIVNGRLSGTNQIHILNGGDVIRIGDFVLIAEAIIPVEEFTETAYINPQSTVFSHTRENPVPETTNQQPEVLKNAPETYIQPEEINKSTEKHTFIQFPDDYSLASENANSSAEIAAIFNLANDTPGENTYIQPHDIIASNSPESTYIQPSEPLIVSDELINQGNNYGQEFIDSPVFIDTPQLRDFSNISAPENVRELAEKNNFIEEQNYASAVPDSTPDDSLINSIYPVEANTESGVTIKLNSKVREIIADKYIIFIAHDGKQRELTEFVRKNQEFFSLCRTITTPNLSEVLSQESKFSVSQKLPATNAGGYQIAAAMVANDEVLGVIFLRDVRQIQSGHANEEAFLKVCNVNQVLLATNVPSAVAIVNYIIGGMGYS